MSGIGKGVVKWLSDEAVSLGEVRVFCLLTKSLSIKSLYISAFRVSYTQPISQPILILNSVLKLS